MYMGQVKRKKINLWLLILLVLFIIAIIFTIIHITNSTNANSDERYSKSTENKNTIAVNREYSGSQIGTINEFREFGNIEDSGTTNTTTTTITKQAQTTTTSQSNENTTVLNILELNNHTYSFKNSDKVSLEKDKYIEMQRAPYIYRMNTEKVSYNGLKSKENLKAYFQDTLHVLVTSEIKIGNMKGTDLIICSIADKNEVAYLIVTPLNDSEIFCLKIYQKSDMSNLVEDLSTALSDISVLKSSIQ